MIGEQRRYSQYTLRNYKFAVDEWDSWLCENEFFSGDIANVKRTLAKDFIIYLLQKYDRNTLHNKVSALRSFYKFLLATCECKDNPFANITLPKKEKSLPIFLNEKQIVDLLKMPETLFYEKKISDRDAFRDKIILELLYGAGFRISELCGLCWENVDLKNAYARIIGKGKKERVCPFGKSTANMLELWKNNYLDKPTLKDFVLASSDSTPLYPRLVQRNLKKYLALAGLPLDITPHKLRHSYATHLINAGMGLRSLQELLGHSSLSTTQIYTHLSMKKIRQDYNMAHPHS